MHGLGPGTHIQVERKEGFQKNCKEGFAQISETSRPSFYLSWVICLSPQKNRKIFMPLLCLSLEQWSEQFPNQKQEYT